MKSNKNRESNKGSLKLSPTSGLNLFKECPRCFWLSYNKGLKKPGTPMSTLPTALDRMAKKYFDQFRGALPPEIQGKVDGVLLPDNELLKKWRNVRGGLSYYDETLDATLGGGIDDCLLDGDYYIILDFKTKGYQPKDGSSEHLYQTQMDAYTYLLHKNGYKTKNNAFLTYFYPVELNPKGNVKFNIEVVKIETNLERAEKLFSNAVKLLKEHKPEPSPNCELCKWYNNRLDIENS